MTPTTGKSFFGGSTPLNIFKNELLKKKRMSYDFLNLKNVDGKVIKNWQKKHLEDNTVSEEQNRDIKFGGFEILDTDKLRD